MTSCPFVYVKDRTTGRRRLWGEAYAGAVVKTLARTDRMRLPDLDGDEVELVLANEAPETQYTDAAWLEVVDRLPGTRVVATHDASLLSIGPSIEAERVVDGDGVEQTGQVGPDSEQPWATDLAEAAARRPRPSFESLTATFGSAPEAAVLELDLRNSPWLDRVSMLAWAAIGQGRVERAQEQGRSEVNAARARELMEVSGIHVRVEVGTAAGWEEVARIPPVGWVGRRHLAVPLPHVPAGEPVEVRLTGGIGFLLVYRMAMAPSLGAVEAIRVPATHAVQSTGADELARLQEVDDDPNVLQALHESVALTFALPPRAEDRERAVFLVTHGYYEVHPPEYLNPPPVAMRALRRPESFGAVGLELFERTHRELIAAHGQPMQAPTP